MKQFRHDAVVGMKASIFEHNKLSHGVITNSYFEDGKHIMLINDDYEIIVNRCEEVIDLITGDTIIRVFVL